MGFRGITWPKEQPKQRWNEMKQKVPSLASVNFSFDFDGCGFCFWIGGVAVWKLLLHGSRRTSKAEGSIYKPTKQVSKDLFFLWKQKAHYVRPFLVVPLVSLQPTRSFNSILECDIFSMDAQELESLSPVHSGGGLVPYSSILMVLPLLSVVNFNIWSQILFFGFKE